MEDVKSILKNWYYYYKIEKHLEIERRITKTIIVASVNMK